MKGRLVRTWIPRQDERTILSPIETSNSEIRGKPTALVVHLNSLSAVRTPGIYGEELAVHHMGRPMSTHVPRAARHVGTEVLIHSIPMRHSTVFGWKIDDDTGTLSRNEMNNGQQR